MEKFHWLRKKGNKWIQYTYLIKKIYNKVLINYVDENYKQAQKLQTKTAKKAGFTELLEYGSEDVDESFRLDHKDIFSIYSWKRSMALETVSASENTGCSSWRGYRILLWIGSLFFRSAALLLKITNDSDMWFSVFPLVEKQFTKKICV